MVIRKAKSSFLVIMAFCIIVSTFVVTKAYSISRACQNSSACLEAVEKEKQAKANAASAASTASAFQSKVNELSYQIAKKESEIASTEAEIEELNRQIEETEAKLLEDQGALAELLVDMYFESDSEPITILAGSSSISDLAEKQARKEVVKNEITASAQKVKETKTQLEEDKATVERLLEEQESARTELVSARAEQEALVAKYQNDAASYTAVAEAAKLAQQEAERAEQEAHPELYRGSSYTGINTYPWQNECPGRQDDYITYWEDAYGWHKIGGYVCECVSYASWKVYEYFGIDVAWGNAYSWDDSARYLGYTVNHTPAANTVGQIDTSPYGHVFWVESVNADGSISVTEYNNSYATYLYSGISRYGDFGSRTIPASSLWQYNFIHFE